MNTSMGNGILRRGAVAAALACGLAGATPGLAEPADAPLLPPPVAEHFRSLGVTVDPRQLPADAGPDAGTATAGDAAAAAGRLRVGVYRWGSSATIATIPLGRTAYATVWQPGPSFASSRIERLTVAAPAGRATAELSDGRLRKVADDRGDFVGIGGSKDRRTLTVAFHYGYARDRRTVDLPADLARLLDAPAGLASDAAPSRPAAAAGRREARLKVKVCKHWPKQKHLLDAWLEIAPDKKPDKRVPAFFPLGKRSGTTFSTSFNVDTLAGVDRDPAKVTAAVGATSANLCGALGRPKQRDLCTAFGGEVAATDACRRILAPFSGTFCPAVADASGWRPGTVDERRRAFAKPYEARFNVRFLSPYGYSWVSSTPVKTYGPNSKLLEATLELPCWDVYEAPVTMSGSYQWPTCFSPYAEAKATVQFANYMKGWYAWTGLSNWKLTVFQTQDCLSRNYLEGPFTPAGTARLKGNYAHWTFSNDKWGGPDNFEAHINFSGGRMWGNVKDSRRGRRTSERATLYGEFGGGRAR